MLTQQQLDDLGYIYNIQTEFKSPTFVIDDYIDRELTIDELIQIGKEPWGTYFMGFILLVPLAKKIYIRTSCINNMGTLIQKWGEIPYVELN